FSSKFSIRHELNFTPQPVSVGYAGSVGNDVIFAKRSVQSCDNTLFLKYNFTNRMGLTLRTRHYVSEVENKAFYHLNSDGSLTQRNDVVDNFNRNANFFNVDMVYTWQFGP